MITGGLVLVVVQAVILRHYAKVQLSSLPAITVLAITALVAGVI